MLVRSSPAPTFAAVATVKHPLTRLRFLVTPPFDNPRAGLSSSLQLRRGLESTARDPVPFRKEQSRERERDEGGAERPVHCEVDVISWRERKIRARVVVNASVEDVWGVLTDYDRLADFVPNLLYSGTVPCPHPGRIWLEQRGLQRALYWQIEARVVLDLQELPNSSNGHELHFSMIDGDFKKFEGKWSVKAVPRSSTTTLTYEVSVIPRFNFPAMFIERIIRSDLPVNLRALANRAEKHSQGDRKIHVSRNFSNPATKVSFSFSQVDLSGTIHGKGESPHKDTTKNSEGIGAAPTSPSSTELSNWGVFGKFCSLDKPCMVDEVHLRRFDGLLENGGVHRCVVGSITVKAPTREVWNVLTAYEKLPEFVPNLAISKVLLRDNNRVRILQEGCKGLLYMVLHARVILDLHEHVEKEISFEQVEGDFDLFHGKWLLEQLGNDHTLLKYIIESKIHKDTFLSEAIVEEVIYEDLPSNLCAIRDYIEKREAVASTKSSMLAGSLSCPVTPTKTEVNVSRIPSFKIISGSKSSNLAAQRSKVPGLQRDIKVLKSELLSFISKYGQEGFMPMRKQLRQHGRVDIEKAIARMGGFRKIADSMNLCLAYKDRKPKGYWDNLENLQKEISQFQSYWGMDPMYMPSRKTFERAGRYDIARALEKWGGLHEVSRLLHLELRHPRKQSLSANERNNDSKQPNDCNGREKTIYNPYITQDTQKWLMKLTDLDINWLE